MTPSREEFLARRKQGIGGSDVAAVLGVSPYRTPYQVWLDKTGQAPEREETEILHFGQVLEQVIADEFVRRNGVKVQRRNAMYHHKDHPELVANIDRYIVGGKILECKTCNAFAADKFGKDGDSVPDEYLLQVQHYMHITGIHEAVLAVLIGGNQYRQFELMYDWSLADFAAAKCVEFWQKYVLTNTPPPATEHDDLAEYYTAKPGASINASPEMVDLIAEAKAKKAEVKALEKEIDSICFEIKNFAGNHEIITMPGGKLLATWKQQADRTVEAINWQAIAEEMNIPQEIIAKHTTVSFKRGNRPLNFK